LPHTVVSPDDGRIVARNMYKMINILRINILRINYAVASTKETTLIGRISDIVRSGRGPDFVA